MKAKEREPMRLLPLKRPRLLKEMTQKKMSPRKRKKKLKVRMKRKMKKTRIRGHFSERCDECDERKHTSKRLRYE
jgi:hypothetical protein